MKILTLYGQFFEVTKNVWIQFFPYLRINGKKFKKKTDNKTE